jgi:hypothetical protein
VGASSYNTDDLQTQFEISLENDVISALKVKWPTFTVDEIFIVNMTQVKTGWLRVTVQVIGTNADEVVNELVSQAGNSSSTLYSGTVTSNVAGASDGGSSQDTITNNDTSSSLPWPIIGGAIGGAIVLGACM